MTQDLQPKKSNFVSLYRSKLTTLLDLIGDLNRLRSEWDDLEMSPGSGTPYELTQDDLKDDNGHLTPQILADSLASLDVLKAPLAAGHHANLAKVRR